MKIAIIGSGISGLLAARLLADEHEIHVFEADNRVGGHTNTVTFEAFGQLYAADTGFMVFNDRTYPNFIRLLQMLDVPARMSDMSGQQIEKMGRLAVASLQPGFRGFAANEACACHLASEANGSRAKAAW